MCMATEGLIKELEKCLQMHSCMFKGSSGVDTLKVYLLICGHIGSFFFRKNMLKIFFFYIYSCVNIHIYCK